MLLAIEAHGIRPCLFARPDWQELDPLRRHRLRALMTTNVAWRVPDRPPFPVLHLLGDDEAPASADDITDAPAIILFEGHPGTSPAATWRRLTHARLIVTATSWTAWALRDAGLKNVIALPPGVDTGRFHPAPRVGLFPDRFVVLAGIPPNEHDGLEILLAAFARFRHRHSQALLVRLDTPPQYDTPIAPAHSRTTDDSDAASAQLARHGIPPDAVVDARDATLDQLPALLRECHLAVFPARRNDDGDPLALAAMACGLPCVLTGTGGHLDLIGEHAHLLKAPWPEVLAGSMPPTSARAGMEDALLNALEHALEHPEEAERQSQAAAHFAAERSHARRHDRLLAAIERAAGGDSMTPPTLADRYAWGLTLHKAGRLAEAEAIYDDVLHHAPNHVPARGDRGNARRDRGDLVAAEADFRHVVDAHPTHARAWRSLGTLLRLAGRPEDAVDCLRRALANEPAPLTHWELAFTLLLLGRYAAAWPHFEYRHAALGLRTPHPSNPRWTGEPLGTRTLLVVDEQGLGDTLQFLRFLADVPRQNGRVVFAGKPATLPVVRRLLPHVEVVDWNGPLPHSDTWVALMSLPARLGITSPGQLPPPNPTDHRPVDATRVARWRSRVRDDDIRRPVVGLCWRGNPDFANDASRSPGLAAMTPLLDVEGPRFIALQTGRGRHEIGELALDDRLVDIGGPLDAAGRQVLDTLAVLESCDLVITSCTSVVHMAGLLNRPCWVVLSHRPDWRWMTTRTDTPWYPSLRLFRQSAADDWAEVVARVADAYGSTASSASSAPLAVASRRARRIAMAWAARAGRSSSSRPGRRRRSPASSASALTTNVPGSASRARRALSRCSR
nr:tetratricopeptide repeat protein [Modicisalibacter sp. R2A 31.J]